MVPPAARVDGLPGPASRPGARGLEAPALLRLLLASEGTYS